MTQKVAGKALMFFVSVPLYRSVVVLGTRALPVQFRLWVKFSNQLKPHQFSVHCARCSSCRTRAENSCASAHPIWSDAGRIPNPSAAACTIMPPPPIEDPDLREALLRGISETGVPTIETDWVPPSKQSEIGATFTKIAKPTLQCMFEPSR